ncbi:YcxB family protein [Cardiobacterium hominis]|uniref:YcxB-like C-terminal domain-containing protein n=1 Tax=Cardiobacterium hominis TaxID=2718 RepID=A0A1C3H220_9GAMM|nr:YcxB family protein [Cardiobacterium hominis]SAM57384.1 hypothetical protein CHUV0807_0278 [Cardiobacterium hominis]
MHNSDTLQVSFSVSSREQRRAGRRMWRYRAPDLKRRYWLATLLLVVIFAALFYGFSENVRRVTHFLGDGCYFLPQGEISDGAAEMWDNWSAGCDAVVDTLWQLPYWMTGLLLLVIFYLRWNYSLTLRALFDPLDGRQFVLSVSAEGLLMEEAGRTRLFYFWPTVSRVILDKEFLLFYVNRNVAWFIPLDRFANQAAAEAFFQQALQFKEQS